MPQHQRTRPTHRGSWRWTVAVLAVGIVAGLGFRAANVTADGTDLRPATGDVTEVLSDRAAAVTVRRQQAAELQREIDKLASRSDNAEVRKLRKGVTELEPAAGLTKVEGPGLRVALDDAPTSVKADGFDPNLLVVHQQDIQAFVNAMWAGGAKAVTIQGQRIVSVNGIRCVGNTVVLDGVPYSPPYVIEAVGDPTRMREQIDDSPDIATYRTWVDDYQLGLDISVRQQVVALPYSAPIDLRYATVTGE